MIQLCVIIFFYFAAYATERPVGKSRDTYMKIIDVLITEIAGVYFFNNTTENSVSCLTFYVAPETFGSSEKFKKNMVKQNLK